MSAITLSAPEPLAYRHDFSDFSCGEESLDDWLRRRAGKNEQIGASRTYVVCEADRVMAYYSLAVGSVEHKFSPGFFTPTEWDKQSEVQPARAIERLDRVCRLRRQTDVAVDKAKERRNMPDPVPVMMLARLAVDTRYAGRNIGTALVRDAVLRTLQASHIVGIRALMVHALHERAAGFYANRGFLVSPIEPLILFLPLSHVSGLLEKQ